MAAGRVQAKTWKMRCSFSPASFKAIWFLSQHVDEAYFLPYACSLSLTVILWVHFTLCPLAGGFDSPTHSCREEIVARICMWCFNQDLLSDHLADFTWIHTFGWRAGSVESWPSRCAQGFGFLSQGGLKHWATVPGHWGYRWDVREDALIVTDIPDRLSNQKGCVRFSVGCF